MGVITKFIKTISFQPDGVNLSYFKLGLFDLREYLVWNIKGLQHRIEKFGSISFRELEKDGKILDR